ncbi:MAG TPA: hypothetical protein DDX91_03235 [Ruminococcaceae bacterium]|nr:hypothetical protein [Oscillospiraceae bacterium]
MTKRNETLDIIRIAAMLCINGIHFFHNSGFYGTPVEGGTMMLMCTFRNLFIICVPMFLMLSGYLMNQKKPEKKYFLGIFKTINTYIICSVVFFLVSKFVMGEEAGFKDFITDLFGFEGTRYGWYIEMYLGLYLLIPFLNILFNGLKDKRQAEYLLAALFVVSMLPSFVNAFRFESAEWWLLPSSSDEYFQIMPQWWDNLYPILFYFAGAYLAKYKPNIPVGLNAVLLICSITFNGAFCYYRSIGGSFKWGDWNSNNSPTIAVTAFLTFTLLLNIKFKKENKIRGFILKTMSNACLFAYLLSGTFDTVYYDIFKSRIPAAKDRFAYAPVMILLMFALSVCSGITLNIIYTEAASAVKRLAAAAGNKLFCKPNIKK